MALLLRSLPSDSLRKILQTCHKLRSFLWWLIGPSGIAHASRPRETPPPMLASVPTLNATSPQTATAIVAVATRDLKETLIYLKDVEVLLVDTLLSFMLTNYYSLCLLFKVPVYNSRTFAFFSF